MIKANLRFCVLASILLTITILSSCKQDKAEAPFNKGLEYIVNEQYLEAIEPLKQAIRIDPEFALAHYSLGFAYYYNGSKGLALDQYKILKELDKDLANSLFDMIYE